ncbi:MAG: hypothetical protein WC663_01765 [Patescibacteria group bacterium]|jgi:hypothetical protein
MGEGEPKELPKEIYSENRKKILECKKWIEVFREQIDGVLQKIEETQNEMQQMLESGSELSINTEKGKERFSDYQQRSIDGLKELLEVSKKEKENQERLLQYLEEQEKYLTELATSVSDQQSN